MEHINLRDSKACNNEKNRDEKFKHKSLHRPSKDQHPFQSEVPSMPTKLIFSVPVKVCKRFDCFLCLLSVSLLSNLDENLLQGSLGNAVT